jgi:hypothetical protein
MRTSAILGGALLAAGVSTASNAAEPTVWQGDLFVRAVSAACTAEHITVVNEFYRSVYRPNIASQPHNVVAEALSLISPRSAFILEATGKTLRGKAAANGLQIGSHAEADQAPTTVNLTITPLAITAKTPVVQIKGTINNLFNETGCNVTVSGALGLRPPD